MSNGKIKHAKTKQITTRIDALFIFAVNACQKITFSTFKPTGTSVIWIFKFYTVKAHPLTTFRKKLKQKRENKVITTDRNIKKFVKFFTSDKISGFAFQCKNCVNCKVASQFNCSLCSWESRFAQGRGVAGSTADRKVDFESQTWTSLLDICLNGLQIWVFVVAEE